MAVAPVMALAPLSPAQQAMVAQAAAFLAKRGYAVKLPSTFKASGPLQQTTVGSKTGEAGALTYAPWAPDSPSPGRNSIVFEPSQVNLPPILLHELLHSRGALSAGLNLTPDQEADEEGYVEAATQDQLPAYYATHPGALYAVGPPYAQSAVRKARLSSAAYYQPGTPWSDPHAVRIRRKLVNMGTDQRTAELERQRQQNIKRAQLRMS